MGNAIQCLIVPDGTAGALWVTDDNYINIENINNEMSVNIKVHLDNVSECKHT